jgi:hypothetical protein
MKVNGNLQFPAGMLIDGEVSLSEDVGRNIYNCIEFTRIYGKN